jgi:hypothetical protein
MIKTVCIKTIFALLMLSLGRLCAGQSIPPWFPKVQPLPPHRGEVIRVATSDELFTAVDRLCFGAS